MHRESVTDENRSITVKSPSQEATGIEAKSGAVREIAWCRMEQEQG